MLAVIIGPLGIGIYSTLLNIINLFTSGLPLGTIGLNKYISEFYESGKTLEINYLLRKFILWNLYLTFPIVAAIIFFSGWISNFLFSDPSYSLLVILMACSFPLSILTGFFDIYLRGIRKINNYVLFVALNSLLSIIIFVPLQIFFKLNGVFIAIIVTGIISVINGLIILKKTNLLPNLFNFKIVTRPVVVNIVKFGFASILILTAQQLSLLGIRLFIISKYSIVESGIFQSVFSISNNYFGLFFSIVGAYALPKLSSFGENFEKMKLEINNLLKIFLLIYTPVIITIFVLRDFVLIILYSKDFVNAGDLFSYQLSGDFLKAISWSVGLWLIPCVKIKQWLLFDLLYSFNFFSIFYLLQTFSGLGIISVSISYLITNLIHLIIHLIYIKRTMKFKFNEDVFRILVYSTVFISIVFLTEPFIPRPYTYLLIIIPVCFISIAFKKGEIKKIVELFTSIKKNRKSLEE